MVGHTHEDIDGMFGCFSKKLKRQNATTLEELKMVLSDRETYRNPVSTFTIDDELVDVKSLLEQHLEPIKNHTQPHVYRFRKETDGKVSVKYKSWSSTEKYSPEGDTLRILRRSNLKAPDTSLILPSFEHINTQRLTKDIKVIKPPFNVMKHD